MSKIIDRLVAYMRHKGLNDEQFAALLGVHVSVIWKARNEDGELSKYLFNLIVEHCPDLNKDWLLFGEGDMMNIPPPDKTTVGSNYIDMNSGASIYNSFNNTETIRVIEKFVQEIHDMRTDFCCICQKLIDERADLHDIIKKTIKNKR